MKRPLDIKNKKIFAIGALCIFALTFLVYSNTLNGFFLSDDYGPLYEIRSLSFSDCIDNFVPHHYLGGYRPLWIFSWYFDYLLWQTNPLGYHITNTILHGLVSVLVLFLSYCISGKKSISFLTAILFVVLPIHSEPVTWISARMEMICALSYLSALIGLSLFLRRRLTILYLFSLFAFLASLLTKEMALSLPLVAFMLILVEKNNLSAKKNISEAIKLSFPFFMISAGYLVFRILWYGQISIRMVAGNPELPQFFLKNGIFMGIYAALKNITIVPWKTLLFPFGDIYFGTASSLVKAVSVFFIVFPCLFIAFSGIRKIFNKTIIYGFTFIIFSSIPISYLISEGLHNARLLYLPSVGYCLIVAAVLCLFFEKIHLSRPNKLIGIGLVLLFNTAVLMANNSIRNSAAEVAYQLPYQIKKMHPKFKESNPILYILGELRQHRGITLYLNGIGDALKLFYPDGSPPAYIIGRESSYVDGITSDFDLRNCYTENSYLIHWDSKKQKFDDLTDKFKFRLRENFEKIDYEAYLQWGFDEILSSWSSGSPYSQFHLTSPRINVPLVRIKAIEIKMRIGPDGQKRPEKGEIRLYFIDQDERYESNKQYLSFDFDLPKDGKPHCHTSPFKITDISQLNQKLVHLELKLPHPQKLVEIEYIRIISFKELREVTFPIWDFKNDCNLWTSIGRTIKNFDYKEGSLLVVGLNEAPLITSPRLDIPTEEVKSIKLKMRIMPKGNSHPQRGKMLWITDTDQIWEEEKKCQLFTIIADGEFHTYEILLEPAILEQRERKLIQLRLFPTSFPARVEIELIELVSI